MIRIFLALVLLSTGAGAALAGASATNSPVRERELVIEPSSMAVGAGTATLTIGTLRRKEGVYTGNYQINVFPYFFKNETGRLAIVVADETLAAINQGKVMPITGTATTSGKDGKTRPITATATPADTNHGTLKLWFMAGDRKMTFEPAYHFATSQTAARSSPGKGEAGVAVAASKNPLSREDVAGGAPAAREPSSPARQRLFATDFLSAKWWQKMGARKGSGGPPNTAGRRPALPDPRAAFRLGAGFSS